jgi:hypothetical protein
MSPVLVRAALALSLLALLLPAAAAARYDEVGGGETKLLLDKGFLALMKRNGVKLAARAPATLRNGVVTFPAVRGKLDPTSGKATVEHDGALLLKAERGAVSFKALQVKTTRRSAPLAAKVGGGQLKLGSAGRAKFSRRGFGASYRVGAMTLAPKVAARLDKRLHLRMPASAVTRLGSAVSHFQPKSVSILGEGRVTLELDAGFLAKLDRLHVAVNPIFPAERPGPFTLGIFGGRLATDLGGGVLETRGGLELLQLGGGKVVWSDARLDFDGGSLEPETDVEPVPPYPGKIGLNAVASIERAAGTVSADPGQRTISLAGAGLGLTATTAATLNEVFARPQGEDAVFAGGEPLGRISFVAQGQ